MTSPLPDTFVHDLCEFITRVASTGNEPIGPDTELVLSGLIDSLGVVVVVEWIEIRLGRQIDPGDVVIEHFETVAAIVRYLSV